MIRTMIRVTTSEALPQTGSGLILKNLAYFRQFSLHKTPKAALLGIACLALAGCWESADVTLHQPGKYQGAVDGLKTDAALLQERFAGQQDR